MWHITLCAILLATHGAFAIDKEIAFFMLKFGIVPDVISFVPDGQMLVEFPSGAVVSLGNEIPMPYSEGQPQVKWSPRINYLYTLVVVDAGVTARIKTVSTKPFLQWLVINIPDSVNVADGLTVIPYEDNPPTQDSVQAWHRYLFLVYRQPNKIEGEELEEFKSNIGDRSGFSVADYLNNYNMTIPMFGNFYVAKYRDPSTIEKANNAQEPSPEFTHL